MEEKIQAKNPIEAMKLLRQQTATSPKGVYQTKRPEMSQAEVNKRVWDCLEHLENKTEEIISVLTLHRSSANGTQRYLEEQITKLHEIVSISKAGSDVPPKQ